MRSLIVGVLYCVAQVIATAAQLLEDPGNE